MGDPTWTVYCPNCGQANIGYEEDVEVGEIGCWSCHKTVTLPYFSDRQHDFILGAAILALAVIALCLYLGTTG